MRWLTLLHLRLLTLLSQPLAAVISLQTLQNALSVIGYPAVTLFVMIESTGIPFPGETMLLLASFFAATNHTLQIPIVIACAALGAILGDNLGYTVGRTGGRTLVLRYGKYAFLKKEHLERAERFFARHGNKTVFFGRFVSILRAWAAFLAGVNSMHWRTFLVYNAAGGIIWATIYGLIGFYLGRVFHDNFSQIQQYASTVGWIGAGVIVAVTLGLIVFFQIRKRKRAQSAAPENTSQEQSKAGTTPETDAAATAANSKTTVKLEAAEPDNSGEAVKK